MGEFEPGADGGEEALSLRIALHPSLDMDDEARDRLARLLRAELSGHDGVESAVMERAEGAPAGTKSGDAVTIGAILVAFSAQGGVLAGLVDTVRDWLGRTSGRHKVSVTINGDTIEIEQATSAQQQELLDTFVRRHPGA